MDIVSPEKDLSASPLVERNKRAIRTIIALE
jgi:hypothetical protein